MKSRRQLGWEGELLAKYYLESKGYHFFTSNFYTRWGEIDLIMQDNDFLVFVEVKYYRSQMIDPRYVITARKRRHLLRSAQWYCVKTNHEGSYRFDLLIIDASRQVSDHYENILI